MVSQSVSRTFEAVLVRQCAPTLAGMKLGSIFCFSPASPEIVHRKVRQWNEQLSPFGLSVQILLERPSSMLIYVYRRGQLEQALSGEACRSFLARAGYPDADLDGLLEQLARRLKTLPEFPHEIGVFLGYPLRDVIGFIYFTQWLINAGVAPETAEKDACRMEHAISEESFHKLMQALETP